MKCVSLTNRAHYRIPEEEEEDNIPRNEWSATVSWVVPFFIGRSCMDCDSFNLFDLSDRSSYRALL